MGPILAHIRRMIRRRAGAALLAGAVGVAILVALGIASSRQEVASPDAVATDNLDEQTAPASGAPPEAGGATDIIPPDESGDDQGSAETPDTNSTDIATPDP